MRKKNLVFVLDAHIPYVRNVESAGAVEESWFFNALTFTYLPLLRSFASMEHDGVPFRIAIAFSPELSEMLADPLMQERYENHLKASIEYAEKLIEEGKFSGLKLKTLENHLDLLRKNMGDFANVYKRNILKGFDYFSERGFVELLATSATYCFFPFYQDIPEAINAQIETGIMAYREHFSAIPEGFWLPALGWFPGIEKTLKAYGMRYSLVENIALLFSETPPSTGVFAPSACENGFNVFPNDSIALEEIAGAERGFCHNPVYLNVDRDIGFTLESEELLPLFDVTLGRRVTGFRFFSRSTQEETDELPETDALYDSNLAQAQIEVDAKVFLEKSVKALSDSSAFLEGAPVCRTCTFPASFFGGSWFEGVAWLETLFRLAASVEDISFARPSSLIKRRSAEKERRQPVCPVFSSCFESGYADELLNSANDWTYPYIKKASARMVDLAESFPNASGLNERFLNAAAREILLAQSLNWPLLMNDTVTLEYARAHFEKSVKDFTEAYEALGSNAVSTLWLAEMERKHPIFEFMNYRVFCRRR